MIVDVEFNSAAQLPMPDLVEAAKIAEANGFSAVWGGEANNKDPIIMLSAIAACTEKIKLGTAIYHLFGRSPVTMAIMSASLDELSNGRFLVGFGVSNANIAGWNGAPFPSKPIRAMREYIELFRQAYAGEKMSYQGEFFSSENFKLAFKAPTPSLPIYLASLGPQMSRLGGNLCDGVMINMAVPSEVTKIAEQAREGARAAGKDPKKVEIICKLRCSLNPDLEAARKPLRQIAAYYSLPDYYTDMMQRVGFAEEVARLRQTWKEKGFRAAIDVVPDGMLDELPTVAAQTIEPIKERIERYAAAGATRIIIPYVPSTDDNKSETRRFLEAWGSAQS